MGAFLHVFIDPDTEISYLYVLVVWTGYCIKGKIGRCPLGVECRSQRYRTQHKFRQWWVLERHSPVGHVYQFEFVRCKCCCMASRSNFCPVEYRPW
jgi:hypothetical protein